MLADAFSLEAVKAFRLAQRSFYGVSLRAILGRQIDLLSRFALPGASGFLFFRMGHC